MAETPIINIKGPDLFVSFLKKLSIVPIILLLLLFTVPSLIYKVDDTKGEVAVIQRFGKYSRTEGSGLHFKLPWDLESVYKVPVYVNQKMEFGFRTVSAGVRTQYDNSNRDAESMMLTGDLNLVDVSWIIQYKIKDAKDYLYNVRSIDDNLFDLSLSVMREVIGDRSVNEVLSEARDEVATEAMENMQKILDQYHMGVHLESLDLQATILPREVKPSFDAVSAAVQEAKQTAKIAETNSIKRIKEETGKANQEINNAEAYKIETINRALGDTQRFVALYAEYKKAPEITKQRLYFDKIQAVLTRAGKVYLVDPTVKGIMPLLNLGRE